MPRVKKEEAVEKKSVKKNKAIQAVKGMRDVLPTEEAAWDYVISTAKDVCNGFGIRKIETPVVEFTDLYQRGVGQITDIVEKEMFSFETQGGDKVSLRPEGTAGVVRAYIENGMNKWSQPVKLYYEGPMFRYEKPQQGRYREHHQFGVEIFGESSPAIDAQVIYLAWKIFQRVGLKNVTVQLNSIGCQSCRAKYKRMLTDYYDMKLNKLCADCKRRLEKNPMRLLDCKEEKCMQVAAGAPQILDNLCTECHDHFKSVLEFLDELEIPYVLNSSLVRGLDYYNRTVFEIWYDGAASDARQISLGGGGRYDGLVKMLGGEDTPAVGFSFGIERLVEKAISLGLEFEKEQSKDVFLVQLGDMARKKVIKIFDKLLDGGISVGESLGRGSIKSQLRTANKMKAKLALIVGQKEAIDDTVIIRDMESGMQETVIVNDIVKEVRRMLNS